MSIASRSIETRPAIGQRVPPTMAFGTGRGIRRARRARITVAHSRRQTTAMRVACLAVQVRVVADGLALRHRTDLARRAPAGRPRGASDCAVPALG